MIILSGADLVLPDRVVGCGTLVIDAGRITSIRSEPSSHTSALACDGCTIVPGFIDAHVHGVDGVDTLDPGDSVASIAALLPRYGVTAFCPTTVACSPADLRRVLHQVRQCRERPGERAARVLPAHLESNFINPAFRGAQPAACLRSWRPSPSATLQPLRGDEAFSAGDISDVLDTYVADVATVTLAPEINGGMELLAWLVERGIRVSIGHSGASDTETLSAIAAGARQVTHLFNALPPMHHRRPGVAGIALQHADVVVELICDGVHVHPAMVRLVVAAKGASHVLAVSDATAAAGLTPGATAHLGGHVIHASDACAVLGDGTMAGSTTPLDAAFRTLTRAMGVSMLDAVRMCSTTPARELGMVGHGLLAEAAVADLVLLDADGHVAQTYVGGRLVYARPGAPGNSAASPSV